MRQARDIIAAIFGEQNTKKAESYTSLFSAWSRIAGEDLAAHSRIVDVRKGSVIVEVDHPGWLQMVRFREKKILKDLRSQYAPLGIERVRVRTATADSSAKEETAPTEAKNNNDVERLRNIDSDEYREFRNLLDRVRELGDTDAETESSGPQRH